MYKLELTDQEINRFWSCVDIRGEDECWPWKHGLEGAYGRCMFRGNHYLSHRIAFLIKNGYFPKFSACHTCDFGQCCNPKHIYDGTQQSNWDDMKARNRRTPVVGSRMSNARLSDEIVKAIKVLHLEQPNLAQRQIAYKFGVSPAAVNNVLRGISWKHVVVEVPS